MLLLTWSTWIARSGAGQTCLSFDKSIKINNRLYFISLVVALDRFNDHFQYSSRMADGTIDKKRTEEILFPYVDKVVVGGRLTSKKNAIQNTFRTKIMNKTKTNPLFISHTRIIQFLGYLSHIINLDRGR